MPLSSGGTLGNVAYLVYTAVASGQPSLALTREVDRSNAGGIIMSIEEGKLVETAPVYGPEDPRCCPSKLRLTHFRWDGAKLQVEKEEQVEGQGGKQ